MVGEPGKNGCVRLFESTRNHVEPVTPHSHRFDLQSFVISGMVTNRIWKPAIGSFEHERTDSYLMSFLEYEGSVGAYIKKNHTVGSWLGEDALYRSGDNYFMAADVIHSIYFTKGSKVLIFEGPNKTDSSIILEPFVDGEVIETFKVEPWMFKR
jgi:hypothetical protein